MASEWERLVPPSAGRKAKISVTVDEGLWREVQRLVGATEEAETASAAVEQGLSMWVANERLAEVLDEIYHEDPDARPTSDEIARAAEALGL